MTENTSSIQYIKLKNGESLISFCSDILYDSNNSEGAVYILHYPYRFNSIVNPMTGTQVGNQLVPWADCANEGPIVVIANDVLTKVDPSDTDKQGYTNMIQEAKKVGPDSNMSCS